MRNNDHDLLTDLKGIGGARKKIFSSLGINTIQDLLLYFPRRHEDRTELTSYSQLLPGQIETIKGTIHDIQIISTKKRLHILKAVLYDGKDYVTASWFYRGKHSVMSLKKGTRVIVTGKVKHVLGKMEIAVTDYEVVQADEQCKSGRIVPFYPLTVGINQRLMRKTVSEALEKYMSILQEVVPDSLLKILSMPDIKWCVKNMHLPETMADYDRARYNMAYRELLFHQLGLQSKSRRLRNTDVIIISGTNTHRYLESFPYQLTAAQNRVWHDLGVEFGLGKAMNRLLQGDVGSGKTVIAVLALLACCDSGFQGVLMAPTEILARQHYEELQMVGKRLGVEVLFLSGSLGSGEKKKSYDFIASGKAQIVVGTHAIIQEKVAFHKLGLVVIDEQHRFGVNQRKALQSKGVFPHLLVMTATPIPRTLALTLYGDMDISVIDEKPAKRGKIITRYVKEDKRDVLYEYVEKQLLKGRQVYVVCPLIEESEKLDLENAVEMEQQLKTVFHEWTIALLHGRLRAEEKERCMNGFFNGEIDILISTTVVEVGINVANANVMIIESAERFGLSQLHQLRGRIGRSHHESYCFLLGKMDSTEAISRIKAMCETTDGFRIAELDLAQRGPGEFFGTKQHGIPEFKVADLNEDRELMELAVRHSRWLMRENPRECKAHFKKHRKFLAIDYTKLDG